MHLNLKPRPRILFHTYKSAGTCLSLHASACFWEYRVWLCMCPCLLCRDACSALLCISSPTCTSCSSATVDVSWTWKSSRLAGAGAVSAYRTVHTHVVPMRPACSSACVVCLPTAAWPVPWGPGAARRVTGFPCPLQYSTSLLIKKRHL